jgi:hypothetical protein
LRHRREDDLYIFEPSTKLPGLEKAETFPVLHICRSLQEPYHFIVTIGSVRHNMRGLGLFRAGVSGANFLAPLRAIEKIFNDLGQIADN